MESLVTDLIVSLAKCHCMVIKSHTCTTHSILQHSTYAHIERMRVVGEKFSANFFACYVQYLSIHSLLPGGYLVRLAKLNLVIFLSQCKVWSIAILLAIKSFVMYGMCIC